MRFVALLLLLSSTALAMPGIVPGEGYTFRLSVGPIDGARARMAVGMPVTKDGHTRVAVQGEAETLSLARIVAPLNATYLLSMDPATLLPADVQSVEKGMNDLTYHQVFDGPAVTVDAQSKQRKMHATHVLGRPAHDALSAYFALRTMPLPDGQNVSIDVLDGPVLWRASLRVIGREDLVLGADPEHPRPAVRAVHLDGKVERIDAGGRVLSGKKPRTISVWLSEGETRVLYRCAFEMELGRAILELTSYIPPSRKMKVLGPSQPPPGITLE